MAQAQVARMQGTKKVMLRKVARVWGTRKVAHRQAARTPGRWHPGGQPEDEQGQSKTVQEQRTQGKNRGTAKSLSREAWGQDQGKAEDLW